MGALVLYVTDNTNVEVWVLKRRPRNRRARYLLRLIKRLTHFAASQLRRWA